MALHKLTLELFIDGEGRDEEEVAEAVAATLRPFGPVEQAFGDFPAGLYAGAQLAGIAAPTEEEDRLYSE